MDSKRWVGTSATGHAFKKGDGLKVNCQCDSRQVTFLSPVLDTALIIFHPEENGSYDEGKKNVDSKLHRQKMIKTTEDRQPCS